jgi:hypothetical protein
MSSRHRHRINRWRAWALPVVPAAANRASPRSQDPQDGCGWWWPPPPAKPTLRPPSPSCTRPNGVAFPATNCSRWPSTTGPNPGCTPEPGGPSNAGWSAAPAGYGPTGPAARPFAHVTRNDRDQVGMERDPRGDGGATCKIAGIAYTGSNPVPATSPLTCGNTVAAEPVRRERGVGFPSGFPPPDAQPTLPDGHPSIRMARRSAVFGCEPTYLGLADGTGFEWAVVQRRAASPRRSRATST